MMNCIKHRPISAWSDHRLTKVTLSQLLADAVIDAATAWLCKQRAHHPPNAEIWHFSFHKTRLIPIIKQEIASNQYTFTPLQIIEKRDGSQIAMWSARDALVLKMLTLVLQPILPCHATCIHIKGNGGSKRAVQITHDRVKSRQYPFVIRTDIKGYYANIDKHQLLAQLAEVVSCPIILNLLSQYLFYSVEQGGNFYTPRKGISRGCALSPLLAGFQLFCIDHHFAQQKHHRYQRYMDDFLILCKTRWQCRRAVKQLNQFFHQFGFKQHPDKTFIGKVTKGFDWLGYQFNQTGVTIVSPRTVTNFNNKRCQLYEQARRVSVSKAATEQRVAEYVARWQCWVASGFKKDLTSRLESVLAYNNPCVTRMLSAIVRW